MLGYCPGTDGLGGRDEGEMEREEIYVGRWSENTDLWEMSYKGKILLVLADGDMRCLSDRLKELGF